MNVYFAAKDAGLYVGTCSPRDGATRYRFFTNGEWSNGLPVQDYNSGDGVKTVLGRKDALLWLSGYQAGRNSVKDLYGYGPEERTGQ